MDLKNAEFNLEEDQREKNLKFVESELEKAEDHYDKAYEAYQLSGGYGSRATMDRWFKQVRLCKLALQAVSNQCPGCNYHFKQSVKAAKELARLEKEGVENLSIEDVKRIFAYVI